VNDTIAGAAENQVARYAAAVRAAFADLSGPERELLLEDLEDHLQEVAAEDGGPLDERLGPPERYAAELRASAGLPAPGAGAAGRRRASVRESRLARRLERSWRADLAHPAGRAVVEFLPELRPAWWVVRGYLAVQAVAVALTPLLAGGGLRFPVPELFGSRVLGLLATVAAVVVSVRLGRRGPGGAGRRALIVLADAALGLFALAMLLELGTSEAAGDYGPEYVETYAQPVSGLRSDGAEISNIFAFDAKGRPLRDVYLVDQVGNPVVATHYGNEFLEQPELVDRDGNEVANRYPRAQRQSDPDSGQSTPVPAPEFRPPPGPMRSPDEPAGGSGTGP
jgi:hypothetical protein